MLMSGIGSYAPQYMSNGGDATTPVRTNGVVAGVPLITGATTIPVTSIDAMGTPLSAEQIEAARRAAGATAGQGKGPAGAGAQSKTPLPSYLYFDGNRVVPYRETNNRQMVETLRLLGLITDEDYAWFSSYFDRSPKAADAVWLEAYFNRPDQTFNRESFFERNPNFDAETQARWNRIFDSIDTASKTGGFATDDDFLMQYTDQGLRSTFGAVRPTGGTPRSPFFTTSDVLVDSSEQPNLYTYNEGQFDPMKQPAPVNPYLTPASALAYPYVPPSGPTPTLTATTADAQPVNLEDTQGRGNIFTSTSTPAPATQTTTPVTTTTTTAPPPTPFVDEELMELDDELKNVYNVIKFVIETRREGEGFLPSTVMPANVLTNKEANQILTAYDAAGRDNNILSSLIAGDVSGQGNVDVDPGDVAYKQGLTVKASDFLPTGPTGLTTTQAAIKAMEERKAAEAAEAAKAASDAAAKEASVQSTTGQFAMGGIVDLTGGMDMSMTGQGLETFLNPERSKATLRRNLAKTAPRPTMQTGIMPMAR